jgi:hypothetical protein
MDSIDEKRVYGARTGSTTVLVASDAGLVRVDCSGGLVGEFGLLTREPARDVAAAGGRVAVAGEDVLLGGADGLEPTGFGTADAVGFDGGDLLAAGDGRVARYAEDAWTAVGELADVRTIDGDLLAAASGVYRVAGGLQPVGLDDAFDVSVGATILAATGSGLYALGNGWMEELSGPFHLVAGDGERAHAAGDRDRLYARDGDGGWTPVDLPVEGRVAGVGCGERTYAVTGEGVVVIADGGGWRSRSLGLAEVRALAVPEAAD